MFGDVAFAQVPFASIAGKTYGVSISETGSVDSTVDSLFVAGGLIDENISALDSNSVVASFIAVNSEAASANDAVNTINNTFYVSIPETASAVDSLSSLGVYAGSVSESASGIDAYTTAAAFVASIAEAASAQDASDRGLLFVVDVSEAASASDQVTNNVVFAGSIAEFVSAVEAMTVLKTVNANVTGLQLVVSVGDVLVWATINDTQSANWQNINDTQTPGWGNLPS